MNYKQYTKKELFGFWFWMHIFIELILFSAFFLVSWWWVLIGVILLEVQFLIFGTCVLNKFQFKSDSEQRDLVFLYPYFKMIGWDVSLRKFQIFMKYIAPGGVLVLALLWQIVLGHLPVLF